MPHFRPVLAVLLSSLIFLGFFSPVLAANYTVSITSTQFVPSTLRVAPGDTITFVNTTSATQSARTASSTGFNTGDIGAGKSKAITVSSEGTFSYSSQYNSALTGTIIVGSSSASASPSATSTASARTSQPAQTQAQPVSGTAETIAFVLMAGSAFLLFGGVAQRRLAKSSIELVDVPVLSSKDELTQSSTPERTE